jgi:hypothetical protein
MAGFGEHLQHARYTRLAFLSQFSLGAGPSTEGVSLVAAVVPYQLYMIIVTHGFIICSQLAHRTAPFSGILRPGATLHFQQIRVSCGVGGGLGAGTAGASSGWCCTASSVPLQTMHDFGVVLPGLNLCLCQGIRLLIRIVPRAWGTLAPVSTLRRAIPRRQANDKASERRRS